MIDYHIHNHFSPDSEEDTRKIAKRAIELGLSEICITNHAEIHERGTGKSVFNDEEAVKNFIQIKKEIDEVQKEFSNLLIKFGVELEYFEGRMEKLTDFINEFEFDFILGSVHVVSGVVISSHIFADDLYERTDEEKAYNEYFDNLYKLIEWGHLDAVAHFDICKKMGAKFYGPLSPSKYEKKIKAILKLMAEKGIGIELNTGSMHKYCNQIYPHLQILKWAMEIGVKHFTLGSDAHKVSEIGRHFKETLNLAKQLNLPAFSTYIQRKPTKKTF